MKEDIPDVVFDIVWAHHWPIFPYLIRKGLKYKKLVNSCISNFLLIERPLMLDKSIDLYLCLTDQMKMMFVQYYGLSGKKIHVLPNTAPDEFFINGVDNRKQITSIAIVSNHVPQELIEAVDIFKTKNVNIVIYGGNNSVNITPDVLKQHDVIITIGKTVQYCLAMGKPVYNYDHFGGSGYITPDNIDVEEAHNFSGRSFYTKKQPGQIVNEIFNQYDTILTYQKQLRQIAEKRYRLSTRISKILKILNTTSNKQMLVEDKSSRLFIDYCDLVVNGLGASSFKPIVKKETQLQRLWRHIKTFRF